MRSRSLLLVRAVLCVVPFAIGIACAAQSQPERPPSTAAAVPPAAETPPPAADAEAPSTAAPGQVAAPATKADAGAEAPRACPEGMKLVDGDYCSDVDHECEQSWYDPNNKKTVCERFAPKSTCVGKRTKKRFCIDTYEWPNVKGERPEVMNRFHQAQLKCAAVGKRMCTESEWTLACEGPKMLPFPYGYVRDTNKCHGDVLWDGPDMNKVALRDPEELARLWKGVRSGSQPECISAFGVADLPGNADEVVASEQTGTGWRAKFDSVHSGGPWYKGVRNQCRPKIYTHDEGFYYYFLSFRCCAETDGKPTEPLTPKQHKEGWKLQRVERIAGFTLDEMKKKLELKKRGECKCGERDVLCKTMCGTLLGPNAKDAK